MQQTSTSSGSGSSAGSVEAVMLPWRSARPVTPQAVLVERAGVLVAPREHGDLGDLREVAREQAPDHAGAGNADALDHVPAGRAR